MRILKQDEAPILGQEKDKKKKKERSYWLALTPKFYRLGPKVVEGDFQLSLGDNNTALKVFALFSVSGGS